MPITGGCRCGAVRYTIEAERITARHCWCRDCQYIGAGSGTVNVFFPSETVMVEGVLCEPRCERQPSAPAILSDMRNPCIHSKRGAAAPHRRARRYTRRSRGRQARHDHLDFECTELGRIRPEYPNSPCHQRWVGTERAGREMTRIYAHLSIFSIFIYFRSPNVSVRSPL